MGRFFTPDSFNQTGPEVPYFEEARADFAPYYRVRVSLPELQADVYHWLNQLGAEGFLQTGGGEVAGKRRPAAYALHFSFAGGRGVIHVYGLPFKGKATAPKLEAARKQALSILRDWLKASATHNIFSDPGAVLVPYMINPETGKTLYEHVLQARGFMPQLPAPKTGHPTK